MKFKEDPWLTDYINAIHFSVRAIEVRTRDMGALYRLKAQTDALVQEALLGNLPMEIFTIRRLAVRIENTEYTIAKMALHGPKQDLSAPRLKTYAGSARNVISDYRFICQGYEEFTLSGITEECSLYFPKIYPDILNINDTVKELFERDIAAGFIVERRPEVFGHGSF